jgi:hypothetical protein
MIIEIYWCAYSIYGPKWVCRLFGQEFWYGVGDTKIEAFLDLWKFNKPHQYID